jgi:hypothetical protein
MNFTATHLIYAIKRLGPETVVFLNRDYKPLGFDANRSGFVDYEAYPVTYSLRISWTNLAQILDCELRPETPDMIHLYDGNTAPLDLSQKLITENWISYVRKLTALAKIKLDASEVGSRGR